MKKAYVEELHNPLPREEDDHAASSEIDLGGNKSYMVGISDLYQTVIYDVLYDDEIRTVSLYGAAGVGKTTLAKEICEDPSIFECRAFVTIGPKYQLKEILKCILAQVDPDCDKLLVEEDEEVLSKYVYRSLNCWLLYLIVLDDVWDLQVWHELKRSFPDEEEESEGRFLLTTRSREVAESCFAGRAFEVPFLDKAESWNLLRQKMFSSPQLEEVRRKIAELEEVGRKIAENCEGLPLLIVTVAKLLSKADKTLEYWTKVAEKKDSTFSEANEQISEVLFPSYEYLPQHLKACFLYMGVVTQNYEIPLSKLIKWWSAEGFLERVQGRTSESIALEFLRELLSKNVFMVIPNESSDSDGGIKNYGLHSSFWYLSNREAGKNKFFYNLNTRVDGLAEGIKGQRRLCIHNNILFGIKDVYNSIASTSTVCSLLCIGPHHPYPVPICLEYLRLLRVLDALTIRFYEFPMEVLNLVHLKYLAITFNGHLPTFISKLWNLECLVIRRNRSTVKSHGNSSYLPMEIWDLRKLEHLQIMGSNLPKPREGSFLPNLLALLDVSAQSCTEDVLERIPNLQKLGIRIELALENVDQKPFFCFDHISHLHELNTLKCVVVNPQITLSEIVAPIFPLSIFPSSLVKLTLSGLGYPWEEMSRISSLPNLRVLKLKCYAFRGPKWEVVGRFEFEALRILLIEDTDLVQWTVADDYHFRHLSCLSIKHCYKLEEIPANFGYRFRKIELVDCNPLLVTRVEKFRENWFELYEIYYRCFPLDLHV
ncbi:PREDICTED: putative late blight resistance protein homolog R1A-10 [Erythranthe guttata]|uniref:putative late blight resistance protein homolog R1A-10 n=1 Tax=Erythranthe guttata TaxID=4155 RepID=UPI00064D9C17|nr:PREDICTED: putative late blight resistance protein homolog R1A-10 [Erythranthe guttata]|eukprot:XP_012829196.1 PREDICTED: putative late blight resistance protein homolog R1A-10 [Erythranthe guttata]